MNFPIVADNLRKGAAMIAVQIAELLLHDFLVTQPKRVSKVQFDKRDKKIYPFNIII